MLGGAYELKDLELAWRELSDEVINGMKEWRLQNPKGTFAEIERELDLRLAKLRGRMLQDTPLASSPTDWSRNQLGERPCAPIAARNRRHWARGSGCRPWGTRGRPGAGVWDLPSLQGEAFSHG